MPKRQTLTAKQKAFVKEYLKNGQNAHQAWLVAVGRPSEAASKYTRQMAATMLHRPAVQARLALVEQKSDIQIQEAAAVMNITKERILEELAMIAFSRPTDIVSWDENGVTKYKGSEGLPDEVKAAIAEIQGGKSGLRIKHHDKQAALVQLGKNLGMFRENNTTHIDARSVNFVIEK